MRFLLIAKRRYINHDLLADRYGRLYELPMALARRGWRGLVLAGDYAGRPSCSVNLPGVEFRSVPLHPRAPLALLRELRASLRSDPPDVVLASGDSHFGALGLRAARRARAPFVFDAYDYYPAFGSNRVPGMQRLFWRSVRGADCVLAISDVLALRLASANARVMTMENGVDETLFRPRPRDEARAALSPPLAAEDTLVGYFGALAPARGIDVLVAACARLRTRWPRLRLLIAGRMEIPVALEQPWIDYRGPVAHATVATMINACNVVTIPYLPDPRIAHSQSCKIAEYLASAVPVVSTRVSGYAGYFKGAPQCVCEPGDTDGLAQAIAAQLANPQCPPLPRSLTWDALGGSLHDALMALLRPAGPSTRASSGGDR